MLCLWASLVAQMVKRLSAMQETRVWSLGWEDPLEKEMAAHSSILAWKIPWTAEPGRLPSMGSQRVGHDWASSVSLFTFHFQYSLEKEMGTHFSILAWKIPWMEEPGGLQPTGSPRVGHDWFHVTSILHLPKNQKGNIGLKPQLCFSKEAENKDLQTWIPPR